MFITRFGKEKQKFKLKITFTKITLSEKLKQVQNLKLKFTRGDHQIVVETQYVRKLVGKFEKKEQTIPLTLYYDEEQKKYLQKNAQIKLYDNDGGSKIAETTINLCDYIGKGKFLMEVEMDLTQSQVIDQIGPTLALQMEIQRQADDSKSVVSSNFQQKGNLQKQNPAKEKNKTFKDPKENKEKEVFIKEKSPIKIQKPKQNVIEDILTKSIEPKNKTNQSKTVLKKETKKEKKKMADFFMEYDIEKNENGLEIEDKLEKPTKNINMNMNINSNNDNNDDDELLTQKMTKQGLKKVGMKNEQKSGTELELYILKNDLRQRDKLISSLKNQNENYKKIISEMKVTNSQNESRNEKIGVVERLERQINKYKQWMIEKQVKISQYQTDLNEIKKREEQNEKTIVRQRKQINNLKLQLENQKYSIAELMQKCFETGDGNLIDFVVQTLRNSRK